MFNFRIIACADGTDVIDTRLKTPYSSLTHAQMEDYIEMDKKLAYMERMKEKEHKRMEHKKMERKRKTRRNLLYRVACGLGLA